MRNLTWLDYNSGEKEIVKEYDDCELAIIMFLLEGEYSFIKIFPVWKDEERITHRQLKYLIYPGTKGC